MNLPDDQIVIATLRKHNAYVTPNRIAVLKILLQNRGSISVSYIRKSSPDTLHRISIYRTLQFFLKKGIIKVIPNSKGNPQYILSEFVKPPSPNPSREQPVYFICNQCGYTELIEQNMPPVFRRPGHHRVSSCYIVLEGICDKCLSAV